METLLRDIRFAARRLRQNPAFTLVAIASLALGIGANTAIFTLVNAVLLRRTPVADPEQVVEVFSRSSDFPLMPFSFPDYLDFVRATEGVFSDVAISQLTLASRDLGQSVEPLPIEMVNGAYFTALGLNAQAGRLLSSEDDVAPGAHPVVVLSDGYWTSSFARSPAAVGQQIRLSGRSYTIIGVAPRAYEGNVRGLAPSLYLPIMMINQLQPGRYDQLLSRNDHAIFVKARLEQGVTRARAQTASDAFVADMKLRHPEQWSGSTVMVLTPIEDIYVHPSMDGTILGVAALLMIVVALVLLVACANLASFLLAQARDRQREIAIRIAIGATRASLIRQLLSETIALSLIGGIAGLALAQVLLSALLSVDVPLPLPITLDLGLDLPVLGFAFVISLAAGVLFGLAPALQTTKPDVVATIKDENTGGGPARRITLRDTLVVAQVALSVLLLLTAGLFLRSLRAQASVDPGFGHSPAALLTFNIPPARYTEQAALEFMARIKERVAALPGVQAVGTASNLHLNPLSTQTALVNVPGVQPPVGERGFTIDHAAVDTGFLRAAGIAIVRGRGIDASDVAGAPRTVVINQAMAERFWPGQDAVGRTLRIDTLDARVIGVSRTAAIRSLSETPRPFMYQPLSQNYTTFNTLVVQTSADAARTAVQALGIIRDMDPDVVMFDTKTMERHLSAVLLPARLGAAAVSAFALLALALAMLGVYGIVNYAVNRRTREVGIRLSLGARPGAIAQMLLQHGVALIAAGALIGTTAGLLLAQALRSFLYGVKPLDPLTFLTVPLLLLLVGGVAAYLPARRTSRLNPADVLKKS